MAQTILIVDDEEKIRQIIKNYLEQEGFQVITAEDGEAGLKLLKVNKDVSLVVLDWMMPGMSGLQVCKEIRQFSDIPIFFLTAKSEEIDKLIGLEIGADDYITKPFSVRELTARIRIVLRRIYKEQVPSDEPSQTLIHDRVLLDVARHIARVDGDEVLLTPTEFKLLATLASAPGRVYSRLQLLEIALGEEFAGYERSIDTHIRNLRKKVEKDPANPKMIMTVFGVGYKLGERKA